MRMRVCLLEERKSRSAAHGGGLVIPLDKLLDVFVKLFGHNKTFDGTFEVGSKYRTNGSLMRSLRWIAFSDPSRLGERLLGWRLLEP